MLLLSSSLLAQSTNNGTLTGSITSKSTHQPIGNVSVVLLARADSSIVSGTMTDAKGKFTLTHIPSGDFYVVLSCIGYADIKSGAISIDPQHMTQNLGMFSMIEIILKMKGITVEGEKETFNNSIDRKVYNIDKDVMGQAGSTSELLQNSPSVSVDIDGNVSLRGSSNVLILINGQTSPLMGKTRADVLQQMPANSIERIEVITNPSAKYKPDGTSGIINLVLKKYTQAGFGGTVSANGGFNSRYNSNLSLNYNPGHFNIFGSYGLRKDNRNRHSVDGRRYYYQGIDTSSYYDQDEAILDRPLSHIATLGIDYNLDERNRLGISGNYFYKSFTRTATSRTIVHNNEGMISGDLSRNRYDPEYEREDEATIYYDHSFAKEDHKLHAEYNRSDQPEQEDNHYTNVYSLPVQIPSYDNTLVKQGERQDQLSIEYDNPISKNVTVETGFSHEVRKQDSDIRASYFDNDRKVFVTDVAKINRFLFDQYIDALYGTFRRSSSKFSFLGGLRFEYVQNRANLVTTDSFFRKDYSSFYPSLHLAYQLSTISELQLNYSRRTNRPEGEDLNPFPEYQDPLNVRVGNPHLLPEYIHSIEFGWQLRNDNLSIIPSLYYRYRYNGFTSVTEVVHDSILQTTEANLSNDQSAGLELIVNGSIGQHLNADINASVFRSTIDASNIGFGNNKSIISSTGNFNINLKFNPNTVLQMNSNYRSSRLTPQGKYLPSFVMNIGGRHNLLDEKLSLVVTISDVFKTRSQRIELRTLGLNRDAKTTRDARLFYAGLIYHFGTSSKKNKEKPIEFDNGQ
ncbi:MAG: TonB-dependent receptor [candidate division Zixibacteria bacterium]|nr:TonB-dependent receptor [candidate division Zixibacteria bacterium]